jgi:hypothetical protein
MGGSAPEGIQTSFKSLAREQFFMRVKSETHRTTIKYRTHDLLDRSLGRRDSDGLDCVTTTLQASTAENSHYTTMCPTSANPVNQRVKKAVHQGI